MADEQAPPVTVEGQMAPTRGAQVRLTGDAVIAARGGFPGDIEGNTVVKQALEADGTVADGYTPDGTTRTGKPPVDGVATVQGEPGGEAPAASGTTRVEVKEPNTATAEPPPAAAPEPPKTAPQSAQPPAPAATGTKG